MGNLENIKWDKQALLDEVNNYSDNVLVNWSELARRYEVKNTSGELARNGGQIIKEYLRKEGIDVQKFEKRKSCSESGQIRKKMKRGAGGEITVPCPVTNTKLKEKLKEKIASGTYNIGEIIVPRKVSQLFILCQHGLNVHVNASSDLWPEISKIIIFCIIPTIY